MSSQKHYMSLYMDTELVEKHRQALAHLNLGKSCIRFKKLEDLLMDVVRPGLHCKVHWIMRRSSWSLSWNC